MCVHTETQSIGIAIYFVCSFVSSIIFCLFLFSVAVVVIVFDNDHRAEYRVYLYMNNDRQPDEIFNFYVL